MTSGAKVRSGVITSTFAPASASSCAALQGRVIARVIIQQNIAARLHIARKNIPGRHGKIIAKAQDVLFRRAAGGNDHHVRLLCFYIVGFRPGVEPELHPQGRTLRHPPVNDANQLGPPFRLRRQPHLPAGMGGGLKHHHLVPALGRHARRFQPRRPRPHNNHAFRHSRTRDGVGHRLLAPGCGVVDTKRHAALIDPVKAVGGANARTDILFAAFDDLSARHMGVGHMGAGHADHIQVGRTEWRSAPSPHRGCGRRGRWADQPQALHAAGKIQMRGGFHAVNRDHIGHRRRRCGCGL